MGHEAEDAGRDGAPEHALAPEVLEHDVGAGMAPGHAVGADARRLEASVGPALGDGLGQAAGPGVVVGQALHHRAQGDQPGGGDHAHLAHAAPQPLALAAGVRHHRPRASEQRAHRRAQALGEAAHDRGGGGGMISRRGAGGHLGVEQAGPVEVDRKAQHGELAQALDRPRGAVGGHVRVLDAQQADAGMVMRGGLDGPAHVGHPEGAVLVVERMELHTGVARRRPVLVDDHVLAPSRDDGRPGLGEQAEGELVAHRPRRHEQRRLLSHALGEGLLEGVDGGVLAVHVVADLGIGHGPPHLGRGPGDGVRPEVDDARRHQLSIGSAAGSAAGSPAGRTSHAQSERFQSGTGVVSDGRGTNFERSTRV